MKYNYNYRNAQGQYAPYVLEKEDTKIINPTPEQYTEMGYYPYTPPVPTEEEIAELNRISEIEYCKTQLQESDYKALKYVEGWINEEDYAPIKAERLALRDRINELELINE